MSLARTLLVTGASGFLGRHMVTDLRRAGCVVRRAVREPGDKADVAVGNIDGATDWSLALEGVDAVIHLAAMAHRGRTFQVEHADAYRTVNIDGTLNLARQAVERGVRRFVFASSIGVHGLTTDRGDAFSERSPFRPASLYSTTKAEAEVGLEAMAGSQFAVAALRMPLIYGVGAPGNLNALVRAVDSGWPLPLASVRNKRAFVSASLVASFVVHWLMQPAVGYEPYLLAHAEQVSTPEFVRLLGAARDRRPRLLPLPTPLLVAALEMMGRRDTAHGLCSSLELDIAKALSTGWVPRETLSQGLQSAFK